MGNIYKGKYWMIGSGLFFIFYLIVLFVGKFSKSESYDFVEFLLLVTSVALFVVSILIIESVVEKENDRHI